MLGFLKKMLTRKINTGILRDRFNDLFVFFS